MGRWRVDLRDLGVAGDPELAGDVEPDIGEVAPGRVEGVVGEDGGGPAGGGDGEPAEPVHGQDAVEIGGRAARVDVDRGGRDRGIGDRADPA